MKKFILSLICTAVLGAGALGVAGVSASASGNETSGMVTISENEVMPFEVVNVGGGTWNYGVNKSSASKTAWSDYYHRTKAHGSTASVGREIDRDDVGADDWSEASATGETKYQGKAYWRLNE